MNVAKKVKRLLEQFKPRHYDLELEFSEDKTKFSGKVVISGRKVGRPSKRISLHQKALKITSAKIKHIDKKTGQKEIPLSRINLQNSLDEVRLHTEHNIYPGDYVITLEFGGVATKQMNGVYPCFFKQKGKENRLIASQFESHHAREAFPSIDEPEAKATFSLTLNVQKGETVLSNTPAKKTVTHDQLQTVVFEKTPIMSTYLLAFVFGELKYLEKKSKSGVVVRTYATADNVVYTKFALDVAVQCLDFYNNYFAIPYPLKKCDMVALPDFASGAMENWGLITYRERVMLVDPKHTSLSTKQWVAMVVAHELAHQWFGNLVTMRWWTDLWLNEGFASWIEYLAIDNIFPDWEMWTQFIADEQQTALRLDALENTHPIEVPVKHPDEIRSIFDIISYQKGSSVIHMLEQYLGHDTFRDGLRYYLKKHAYKNTDTVDLWAALEEVSSKPVRNFMNAWTSEPGYPILRAQVNDESITLNQQRFYLNHQNIKQNNPSIWQIPTLSNIPGIREVLKESSLEQDVDDPLHVKLNKNHSGFYRTFYNPSHAHLLGKLVSRGKLSPLDRLGLLADSFEASKAGYSDIGTSLDLLGHYNNEDNSAVWEIIFSVIGDMRLVFGNNDEHFRKAMEPFIRTISQKQVDRLGWKHKNKESYFDSLLRPSILGLAASANNKKILNECIRQFKAMKRPENITPDLRGVIWGTVARTGSIHEFNTLVRLHNSSNNSEVKVTLGASICGFKQPALFKKALAMIKSESVRHQDVGSWVATALANRWNRQLAWQWLKDNWAWLEQNLGTDLSFSRFPVYAARSFSEEAFLKDYKKFFANKKSPAMDRSINQGIEIIEWHISWKDRAKAEALAFFKAQPEN